MSAHRFFLCAPLQPEPGGRALGHLSAEDLHHARDVLRIRPGESVELVEPDAGPIWQATLIEIARDHLVVDASSSHLPAVGPRVTLVQGVAKGEKMDSILRQAVEVGAGAVIPVITRRTVVRLDEQRRKERGERWRRIARSAAEQSHRDALPDVSDPVDLGAALPDLAEFDRVLVFWEEADSTGVAEALGGDLDGADTTVALVVGPEGGLEAEEVESLTGAGARIVTLGPTILRTETAAIVGLALVLHELGCLGASRG
jgi:16S rRNA (uracil1498-N3)-methyltransferase